MLQSWLGEPSLAYLDRAKLKLNSPGSIQAWASAAYVSSGAWDWFTWHSSLPGKE